MSNEKLETGDRKQGGRSQEGYIPLWRWYRGRFPKTMNNQQLTNYNKRNKCYKSDSQRHCEVRSNPVSINYSINHNCFLLESDTFFIFNIKKRSYLFFSGLPRRKHLLAMTLAYSDLSPSSSIQSPASSLQSFIFNFQFSIFN